MKHFKYDKVLFTLVLLVNYLMWSIFANFMQISSNIHGIIKPQLVMLAFWTKCFVCVEEYRFVLLSINCGNLGIVVLGLIGDPCPSTRTCKVILSIN